MSRRNYQELSSYDFEGLVKDLLAAEWGERLESFPPGRDDGIDIRLLKTKANVLKVVQCKHSPGGSWTTIRSKLVDEAEKLRGRDLGEYWLATSASLSPMAKDKACELFHEQDLSPEHVLGSTDIDTLLDIHPGVERANYKLYITSAAVLELLLHNDLFVHAQDLLEGIEERRKYYVQGASLAKAQQVLHENHVCIISGPPGVGKTTLAEMLALNLIMEGYKPFWISEDVREADTLWRNGQKQLFLYDDFLGQNALADKLGKNEDSRLLKLMQRAKRSPNHHLILTTREYILNAARQTYERLRDPSIEYLKVIVDLSSYSRFNRAHILYNHVYFSDLQQEARSALKLKRNYTEIIEHENYNPRLIRLIVDTAIATGGDIAGGKFPKFAKDSLSSPIELWDHIFSHQLKEVERDILLVLLTFTSHVSLEDFRLAVQRFQREVRERTNPEEIRNALAVLDGVFINVAQVNTLRVIRFANPGIRDYLLDYVRRNPYLYTDLVSSVAWPEQVQALWQLVKPVRTPHFEPSNKEDTEITRMISRVRRLGLPPVLFRQEIHSAFTDDPDALLDANLKMLGEKSSFRVSTHMPDGSIALRREEHAAESTAFVALEISKKFIPRRITDVLHRMVEILVPAWKDHQGDKQRTLTIFSNFADEVIRHPESAGLWEAARAWAAETLHSPEDYMTLRELEEARADGEFDGIDDLCNDYYDFAKNELDDLWYGDNPDTMQEELETITLVAEEFGLTSQLERYFERVQSKINELGSPTEEDEDTWRGSSGHGDDGDVAALFSTLD